MIKKQHYTAPGADIFELRVEGQILVLSGPDSLSIPDWKNGDVEIVF